MTNRDLVTRLLNLDVLVGNEAGGLDLEDELPVNPVRLALIGGALDDRVELLRVDKLVDFVAAAITGVYSHLHARLDIAGTGDNSPDLNE